MENLGRAQTYHLVRAVLEHPFGAGVEDTDHPRSIRRDHRHFGSGVEHTSQTGLGARDLDDSRVNICVQAPILSKLLATRLPEVYGEGEEAGDQRAEEEYDAWEIRRSPSQRMYA